MKMIAEYDARTILGYPVTVLDSAYEDEELDAIGLVNAAALGASVAVTRALIPLQLCGAELRFLRKAMGRTGKEFAEAIDVDPAVLSRWENDKQTMGGFAEKVIRQYVLDELGEAAAGVPVPKGLVPTMKIVPRDAADTEPLRLVFRLNADTQSGKSGVYARAA